MFGTMGFSELVIILVIVLILFGSSRLPALGEGVGKALKGFKKAVHEEPPPLDPNAPAAPAGAPPIEDAHVVQPPQGAPATSPPAAAQATAGSGGRLTLAAYQPGPEATPGTTAAMIASAAPQAYQPKQAPPAAPQAGPPAQGQGYPNYQPPTMEQRATAPAPMMRAQYPPLPPGAQPKPQAKRPSAIVNKDAVARVQAQQAALKANAAQQSAAKAAQQAQAPASSDMQSLGEGLGDALRTFRNAVNDVRSTVDPQMRTIQAEIDAAHKEIEQTVEDARQIPSVQEEPPRNG
jgi:TatA/E family protein of Tat protein translocase